MEEKVKEQNHKKIIKQMMNTQREKLIIKQKNKKEHIKE